MPTWYAPSTPGEGLKRFLSLLNLLIIILVIMVCASEFRYDWAERLVGNYLMVINPSRPETGGIWEAGRQTLNAHQSLNRIIDKKQSTLRHVREAESFSSLAGRLGPGEWVNLDRQQFKGLFNSLPAGRRDRLIPPAKLVWLLATDVVDRIFCEGQMNALSVYFIDTSNRVIFQLSLDKEEIDGSFDADGIPNRLEDMGGIFPEFFRRTGFSTPCFNCRRIWCPS